MYDVKLKRKGLANNKEIWLIKRHGATHVVSRINFFIPQVLIGTFLFKLFTTHFQETSIWYYIKIIPSL